MLHQNKKRMAARCHSPFTEFFRACLQTFFGEHAPAYPYVIPAESDTGLPCPVPPGADPQYQYRVLGRGCTGRNHPDSRTAGSSFLPAEFLRHKSALWLPDTAQPPTVPLWCIPERPPLQSKTCRPSHWYSRTSHFVSWRTTGASPFRTWHHNFSPM